MVTSAARHADAAWTRIETWLARRAPGVHAALCPPARDRTLKLVAEATGAAPPTDLAAWWKRRHGLRRSPSPGSLFPDRCDPLPLEDALRHRALFLDTARRTCPPELRPQLAAFQERCARQPAGTLHPDEALPLWLPAWIPVAHDAAGSGLFADLRAGPRRGCLVRYTNHGQAPEAAWPDLTTLLTYVADTLESLDDSDRETGGTMTIGRWTVPGPEPGPEPLE
ncbi:SMI1/KNR4 family protein [Streptomyces apricus]|uniref:Knr4/Smi1-like domain-containing protein n=1 Tax=Streptomyces apricus TaxID=1828112 RepID=A0A5B0BID2_9ACTN|nr:hypothetical protein [Streptomyces apricus]KAA0940395.1 hypothetical protein FGF04_09905 [Streptomyces apricus]